MAAFGRLAGPPCPAALLADIQAGKIDIVVVYKVDRLTRSLADFAKLVELFDQRRVVRLGHAVIQHHLQHGAAHAQRAAVVRPVRARGDRGAGARQDRGLQAQGYLGRRTSPARLSRVDKKLVVVPDEAETVRTIFHRYLELGSIGRSDRGPRPARHPDQGRRLSTGRSVAAVSFGDGALAYLLKNRFYIGEVVYRGAIHRGEHEPILDRELFEAVQAKLARNAVDRQLRPRAHRPF